jgi:ABC-type polysaccharide/polyol phosphate export permease
MVAKAELRTESDSEWRAAPGGGLDCRWRCALRHHVRSRTLRYPGPVTEAAAETDRALRGLREQPRQVLRSLLRWLHVLFALTESDLRFRYGRGPGRIARWLLEPFALVGIYLLLTAFVLDSPGEAPGLALAAAVVPFQFVMNTVANAMNAVHIRRGIVLNIGFDRNLLPFSSTLAEGAAFVASFSVLIVMMMAYHVAPTSAMWWLPLVILVTLYLVVAAAYASTLLGLWLWEFKPFLLSFVRMLFFLSPGLVVLSQTGSGVRQLLQLNPLTGIFELYRDVFLYGKNPEPWQFLYPMAVASLLLLLFVPIFRSEQRHFAKIL